MEFDEQDTQRSKRNVYRGIRKGMIGKVEPSEEEGVKLRKVLHMRN